MKLIKSLIFILLVLFFVNLTSSATLMVNNPINCPSADSTVFPGQSCAPDDICGDNSGLPFCVNTGTISPPAPTTNSGLYGLSSPGFGVNCYYTGDLCSNHIYCQRNPACFSVNRLTQCTDWGVSECSTCITGYQYCDGSYTDVNGCEIQTGVTSRGTNVVYGTSCSYQCSSGYLDCNGDSTGSDGACEIQVGVTSFGTPNAVYSTCTTATCSSGWQACEGDTATVDGCNYQTGSACTTGDGKPGTLQSGCVCQELAQEHFITNTEARGWGDFLLFGKQYNPIGWLMNLTNSEGKMIGIDNESCLVFSDGSRQCVAGGGSSIYTFTNGLTENNGTVSLGGTLNSDINFTGANNLTLGLNNIFSSQINYLQDYSSTYTARSLVDRSYVQNQLGLLFVNYVLPGDGLTYVTNTKILSTNISSILYRNFGPVKLGPTGMSNDFKKFETSEGYIYIGPANAGGTGENPDGLSGITLNGQVHVSGSPVNYLQDYSSTYTDRSLVDKAYVDSATGGASSYTFTNGLTENNGTVSLGGNLNYSGFNLNFPDGLGYLQISFDEFNEANNYFESYIQSSDGSTYSYLNNYLGYVSLGSGNGTNYSYIEIYPEELYLASTGNITSSKINYLDDYSSTYTDRSLVDKAYVDLIAGGGSVDLSGYVPYTGATQNLDLGDYQIRAINAKSESAYNNEYFGLGAGEYTPPAPPISSKISGENKFTLLAYELISVSGNSGFGTSALRNNIGNYASAFGSSAGYGNIGFGLTTVGYLSGNLNQGNNSTFLGYQSGNTNTGQNVIAIGFEAGKFNNANNTIYIGNQVGYGEAISNRLIIDLEDTETPLIDGRFDSNLLIVNGDLNVTGTIYGISQVVDAGWTISGGTITNNGYSINNQNSGGNFYWYGGNTFRWGDSTYPGSGFYVTSNNIELRNIYNGIIITSTGTTEYTTNVSQYYTNRSLVDKEYVDLKSSSASVNSSNLVPYTGATQNIELGSYYINAKNFNVSNNNQIKIGSNAGYQNTGNYILAIGSNAAYQNSALYLTAVGSDAGRSNTGLSLTAYGSAAGYSNSGAGVVAVGISAGQSNNGQYSTFLGRFSGYQNKGNNSIGIGEGAIQNNSVNNVVAIGYEAGRNNLLANQFIVKQGNVNTTALIQGNFATGQVNASDFCTYSGTCLSSVSGEGMGNFVDGDLNVTGIITSRDIKLDDALFSISIGNNSAPPILASTFFGYNSGYQSTGTYSAGFGLGSLYQNTKNQSTGFGYNAGYLNNGSYLTAIGYNSAFQNQGNYVTALGSQAGLNNLGTYSSFVGSQAGGQNKGNYSIGLGSDSLYNNTASNVVAIGYRAGINNTISNKFIVQQANVNIVPLIEGDFVSGNLTINGNLNVSKNIKVGGCIIYNGGTLGSCI